MFQHCAYYVMFVPIVKLHLFYCYRKDVIITCILFYGKHAVSKTTCIIILKSHIWLKFWFTQELLSSAKNMFFLITNLDLKNTKK